MVSSHSTRSIEIVTVQVDEPKRPMACTEEPSECLYQIAHASKEVFKQEADIMDAWKQASKDLNEKGVYKGINDTMDEDWELQLDWEQTKAKEDPATESDTHAEEWVMIAPELEKVISHHKAPVLAELVEDKFIDTLQFTYDAAKNKKTALFKVMRGVIVGNMQ